MYTRLFYCFGLVLITFCCFATTFCGCKKDKGTAPDSSYIDAITFGGCAYAGDYLDFSFHASGTGPLAVKDASWNFGDGGSSVTPLNVLHIYANPGTYTVTFNVNGTQLRKDITITSIPARSPYTAQMGGKRHWKGSGAGIIREFYLLSNPAIIDTHFAVQVTNAGIIQMPVINPGITLNLVADDTVNKFLKFTDCLSPAAVSYYYMADSIVYYDIWSATTGHGYESLVVHTQ